MAQQRYQFLDLYGVARLWDYILLDLIKPMDLFVRNAVSICFEEIHQVKDLTANKLEELKQAVKGALDEHIRGGSEKNGGTPDDDADHDDVYLRINVSDSNPVRVNSQKQKFESKVGDGSGDNGTIKASEDADSSANQTYALDVRYVPRPQFNAKVSSVVAKAGDDYVWKQDHLDQGDPAGIKPDPRNMRDHDWVYLRTDGIDKDRSDANGQYRMIASLPEDKYDKEAALGDVDMTNIESVNGAISTILPSNISPNDINYPLDIRYYKQARVKQAITFLATKLHQLANDSSSGNTEINQFIEEIKKNLADNYWTKTQSGGPTGTGNGMISEERDVNKQKYNGFAPYNHNHDTIYYRQDHIDEIDGRLKALKDQVDGMGSLSEDQITNILNQLQIINELLADLDNLATKNYVDGEITKTENWVEENFSKNNHTHIANATILWKDSNGSYWTEEDTIRKIGITNLGWQEIETAFNNGMASTDITKERFESNS